MNSGQAWRSEEEEGEEEAIRSFLLENGDMPLLQTRLDTIHLVGTESVSRRRSISFFAMTRCF